MARTQPLQPSFNAGEFGPEMLSRTDFPKYRSALRKAENIVVLPQGGATRRGGSRFAAEVKDSSAFTRSIPFQFSTEQAYIIEAGDLYFRFYRNQGPIFAQNVPGVITNGTFDTDIAGWTDLSAGTGSISWDSVNQRMSLNAGGSGATNQAHAEQEITNNVALEYTVRFRVYGAPGDVIKFRVGTATGLGDIVDDRILQVGIYSFAFTPTAANFFLQFIHDSTVAGTVGIDDVAFLDDQPIELATPYATADLPLLRWVQSADVLYLCRETIPVYKLLRFGNQSWGLEEVNFLDGPYLAGNLSDTTLTSAAATGKGITLTASTVDGINDGQGFLATDVGRLVRLGEGSTIGYGIIVSITSTTVVEWDIRRDVPTAAQDTWSLGAWSETTGYPQVTQFHEQRLGFANTTIDPDKLWLSQTGDFENFQPDTQPDTGDFEVQDDDALDYRISSDQVNAIQWMRSGTRLMIGTRGGEWIAQSDGPVLTPTDIDVKQQTSRGSTFINAVQVDIAGLFVQRAERQIYEFAFSFEADGFRSPELTILSTKITQSRVAEISFAQAPHSLLTCVRQDGRMALLTYKREQDVLGWARWVMGGSFGGGIAEVESVAVIPGTDGAGQVADSTERDEIWVCVKRTINGGTKRYFEVFEDVFEGPDINDYLNEADYTAALLAAQVNQYYADSIITYDGVPATVITGLDHLEGETVKVLGDGAVFPDAVVSGGQITLDIAASVVQVGLGYFHDIENLKLDFGNRSGSAIGSNKNIQKVDFVLHECGSLVVGSDRDNLRSVPLREVADPMDTAVPLFTGELEVEIEGDFIPDPRVIVRSDDPTAFTVLGSRPELDTSER